MNLLAIDASTDYSSVAIQVGEVLLCEELSSQKTHAQLLLPLIEQLFKKAQIEVQDLDGIVFGQGPGSFTGLRIACSIAKGLAYPYNIPLIPVSGLGAITYAAREQVADAPVLAVLDARMQEMYWGFFPENVLIVEDRVNAAQDIQIPATEEIVLAGVGIDLYWADFTRQLKSQISLKLNLYPRATDMIHLAQQEKIKSVLVADAQPVYVRNQVTQGDSRG